MKIFSKISKQTLWQVLGKAVTSFSTFIVLGFVSRVHGQEGTGVFTLAITYLSMFYLLADFGFNAHLLRKLQVQKDKLSIQWGKILGTRIVWSLFLMIAAVGILPFLPFKTEPLFLSVVFGGFAILASGVFVTCNLIFQSKLRYDFSVLATSAGVFAALPLFILFSFYKKPVPFLLIAHFFSWLVIALCALFLVRKFIRQIKPVFDFNYSFKLFKESWPIAATLALNVLYFRADSFIVAFFKSYSDAGSYNVAYSIFQSALVLPTFIMNSYYPIMLKSLSGIKKAAAALLVLSILGSVLTLIFSPLLINILTGGGFGGSIISLRILSLGFPAYFLSSIFMWFLITKGSYKMMLLLYTFSTIMNIVLNIVFVPEYSFYASSWITVFSEYLILILQVVVLWFDARRTR